MKIIQQNLFTPAGTATVNAPATGGVVTLPAVDSGNVSLLVTNNGTAPASLILQTVSQYLTQGAITVLPGASVLFAPSGPADYPNTVAAVATNASVSSPGGGPASFTFTRGTITTQTVIQAP